jgi:hypothetical protein
MRKLHAAVLALYPPALRERYGEEIAELLEQSRTPIRDLADVARSALAERAAKLVKTDLPDALRRTAPGLTVAAVTVLACVAVPLLGFSSTPWTIVLVGLIAGALCARRGNGFGTAAIVIGTLLGLFTAPHLVQLLVGQIDRLAEVLSVAAFASAIAGLAVLMTALVRRNRRTEAIIAATIGALALPQLATTLLVLISDARPAGNPWLAYQVSMLSNPESEYTSALFDILIWYPALLTFCATFFLAFCLRAKIAQRTAARGTDIPEPV